MKCQDTRYTPGQDTLTLAVLSSPCVASTKIHSHWLSCLPHVWPPQRYTHTGCLVFPMCGLHTLMMPRQNTGPGPPHADDVTSIRLKHQPPQTDDVMSIGLKNWPPHTDVMSIRLKNWPPHTDVMSTRLKHWPPHTDDVMSIKLKNWPPHIESLHDTQGPFDPLLTQRS